MSAQLKKPNFDANEMATLRRATAPAVASIPRRRLFTPARIFFLVVVALLLAGYYSPTQRYISPERGLGYILGIIGGSAMLILLLYPLRKRFRWMGFMGSTKHWFQTHMVLGIIGPLLILYHSNFSLGATNSNVALVCMLIVSGSGLFGRYFYGRIHNGLYGTKATLSELQGNALRLRTVTSNLPFLPDLVQRIEQEEAQATARCEKHFTLLRPLIAGLWTIRARIRLYLYVRRTLRQSAMPQDREQRIYRTASAYIDTRLQTTRRMLEFDAYEKLFSLWHILHLPLFFMLVIAGIVHVIAVHVY